MSTTTHNNGQIRQNFMNNISQVDQQECIATVTDTANNNVVIVNGANIAGNFTGVSSTTSTDATCLMVSTMDTSVSNILSASLQQTNSTETDMFGDFSFSTSDNKFNITQSVTNNISQINEALCAANTVTSTDNNYVYVTNSRIGGDFVGVANTANASADCSMSNTMKVVTYNQAQASASQSNTTEGIFGAIVAAFAAIIGLIIVGVIVLFATGAIGYVGYSAYTGKTPQLFGQSPGESALQAAENLGLTPDVLAAATGNSIPSQLAAPPRLLALQTSVPNTPIVQEVD